MLDKHLIAKISGKALDSNIVTWGDYRVTVLDRGLFRIERNGVHAWRDCATQSVWFRNAPAQKFSVEKTQSSCTIKTSRAALILKSELADCRVNIDGQCLPLDNKGNLLGTARTLDNCNGDTAYDGDKISGKVELGVGVCSTSGVAVIDDSAALELNADGTIKPTKAAGADLYVFAYGHDYRAAVNALYQTTGKPPMLPRYALGNWWSRYYVYTDRTYLTLLDKFALHGVPLTVATIDMDWHYSSDLDGQFGITEKGRMGDEYGGDSGWTGYSWNKNLFPDYKAFLQKINARNLNITLNLHPADGVRWFEDCYEEMARAMGVDPATCKKIPFDVSDDKFINNYFSVLHKPYERDGVKFWWIDWQQGSSSRLDGLDPLWALNHYHYMDIAANGGTPMILSRYSGVGSHRYPVGFSGDTHMTWNTLGYLPYFTATASNIGYTRWSHDIGGHMKGEICGELYLRSVQFGVFSPINRLHSSQIPGVTKEPWYYKNGIGEIACKFLRLRHSMIPFLYTAERNTHTQGRALIEPLYYEYPDIAAAYEYKNEYLFGGLIVAPVTERTLPDGYARTDVWLPRGRYTDIFTGDEYDISEDGGRRITMLRTLDSIPVLAKSGTILPLSEDSGNTVANPTALEIKVYSGDGEYELYEDNGKASFITRFELKKCDNGDLKLCVRGEGDDGVVPSGRKLTISFENIRSGVVHLCVNGKAVDIEPDYRDRLTVTIDFKAGELYEITAIGGASEFDNFMARVDEILTEAQMPVADKIAFAATVAKRHTKKEVLCAALELNIPEAIKQKISEIA